MTTHPRPKALLWIIFMAAVLVYLMTAYNSVGFYHVDEHYQILEFAMTKIHPDDPPVLPWEYGARIRSALQPTLAVGTIWLSSSIGSDDPNIQAMILRVFTAIVALMVITFFIRSTEHQISNSKFIAAYHFLSYFLWFIPYISVRFSSETWGGLIFLWSLGIVYREPERKRTFLLMGVLFGLSFLFRFQMAIAIVGLAFWLLAFRRISWGDMLVIAVGFVSVVLAGVLIDSWFYGEWVFTPWNYFETAFLNDAVFDFGTSPWYYYFVESLRSSFFFIGIPMAVLLIFFFYRRLRSPIAWVAIPFLLVHILIPHKELRFLFPLVYMIPLATSLAIDTISDRMSDRKRVRTAMAFIAFPVLALDMLCVAVVSQVPAGMGRMEITREIHRRYGDQKISLVTTSFSDPYDPWHSKPVSFYVESGLTSTRIASLCELEDVDFVPDAVNLLVVRKSDFGNPECQGPRADGRYERIDQSEPEWTEELNKLVGMDDHTQVMVLYRWLEPGVAVPIEE